MYRCLFSVSTHSPDRQAKKRQVSTRELIQSFLSPISVPYNNWCAPEGPICIGDTTRSDNREVIAGHVWNHGLDGAGAPEEHPNVFQVAQLCLGCCEVAGRSQSPQRSGFHRSSGFAPRLDNPPDRISNLVQDFRIEGSRVDCRQCLTGMALGEYPM